MSSGKWKVAIVGAGPAGMFVADELTKREDVRVDLIERLFAPNGLLRFGVAPDHPEMKRLSTAFAKTRERSNLYLLGGVEYGKDVALEGLLKHYHHVVFAHGAVSDRRLNIPGEDLTGVMSARQFVEWYNGHPDAVDTAVALDKAEAVVVGAGNVALDVARILIRPVEDLQTTDIATHALDALRHSSIKKVHMLVRRGPAGVAFTLKEIKELTTMDGVRTVMSEEDFRLTKQETEARAQDRKLGRILDILESCVGPDDIPGDERRVLHLRFFTVPTKIEGSGDMSGVVCQRTQLVEQEGGRASVERIEGSEFTISAGMLFRSIGYKVAPLQELPYDDKKQVIRNEGGQVVQADGTPVERVWVTGWARRGPTGVLGTNKVDAKEVATLILDACEENAASVLPELVMNVPRIIDLNAWRLLDAEEQRRGQEQGRPREKFVRREVVNAFLDAATQPHDGGDAN